MKAVRRIFSVTLVLAGMLLIAGDGMELCKATATVCQPNYVTRWTRPQGLAPFSNDAGSIHTVPALPQGRRSWCPLRKPDEPGRSYSNRQAAYDMARGLKI